MEKKHYNIILASNSPRRKEILSSLSIPFSVYVKNSIDESYPESVSVLDVPLYLSKKKADAYHVSENEVLITADTLVILDNEILGKPKDEQEAIEMLQKLSGKTHQVVTGVSIKTHNEVDVFCDKTDVTFKTLTNEEIAHYVSTYKPLDKAGAYGIQEWIGYIGVEQLTGSYFNVMGFPIHLVYKHLKEKNLI